MDSASPEVFVLTITDAFRITGRGTAVTGYVECGIVKTGDAVEIRDGEKLVAEDQVAGIDFCGRSSGAGTIGLVLRDTDKSLLRSGQIVRTRMARLS